MNFKRNLHLLMLNTIILILFISCSPEQPETKKTSTWTPKRINKCIELLEAGQPIYYAAGYGGYEEGKNMAQTWGDYIVYNMEHNPLDFTKLRGFMQGLVDGGPTPSGHRTPTVIAIVPVLGVDDDYLEGGAWMIQQALAQVFMACIWYALVTRKQCKNIFKMPAILSTSRELIKLVKVSEDLAVISLPQKFGEFLKKNT